jgi:hypothetical protein
MNVLDTFTMVAVAIMVIVGTGFVGGGVRQLRRGPVMAREAVEWRHSMRWRRIIDPQEGMPPRLTDAFVLVWRRYQAGFLLGGGIGLIAYFALSFALISTPYDHQKLSTLAFGLTLLGGSGAGICLGNLWGFSTMRRDANSPKPRRTLGDYRSWLLPMLLVAIILATSAFAAYAIAQAQTLPPYTPTFGSYLPSPIALIVSPLCSLTLFLVMEYSSRRIVALPPLALPMESPLATTYDEKLKSLAIVGMYLAVGIDVLMGCSQLATSLLNVVMGDTFNDHASSVGMIILACWLPYFILVLLGPHPVRRFRERRRPAAQPS